jgi:hypothetical protein
MTIGPDNLGNGSAKTEDRFSGQLGYRPRGSRDNGSSVNGTNGHNGHNNHGTHNGHNGSDPLGGPLDGLVDELKQRNGMSGIDRLNAPLDIANPLDMGNPLDIAHPIAATLTQPKLAEPAILREPAFRADPYGVDTSFPNESYASEPFPSEPFSSEPFPSEPTFPSEAWLEAATGSIADHPLLRGLLLELPPKGSPLRAQYLERWFEAARSILELLYRYEPDND